MCSEGQPVDFALNRQSEWQSVDTTSCPASCQYCHCVAAILGGDGGYRSGAILGGDGGYRSGGEWTLHHVLLHVNIAIMLQQFSEDMVGIEVVVSGRYIMSCSMSTLPLCCSNSRRRWSGGEWTLHHVLLHVNFAIMLHQFSQEMVGIGVAVSGRYIMSCSMSGGEWTLHHVLLHVNFAIMLHQFSEEMVGIGVAQFSEEMVGIGVAVSGRYIMSCSAANQLVVWDLKGAVLATVDTCLLHTYRAKVSPCGRFIVASGFAPDVKVWEVVFARTGEFKQVSRAFELAGHTSGVYDFSFSSDSTRMATVSKDGSWKVFNTNSESPSEVYHLKKIGTVNHSISNLVQKDNILVPLCSFKLGRLSCRAMSLTGTSRKGSFKRRPTIRRKLVWILAISSVR
ncbi:Transducin beta-like protein 2 [Homalodisca vitripennis]|nr:Transducin beta-like protein 2 [Homalodisca vitripennis]